VDPKEFGAVAARTSATEAAVTKLDEKVDRLIALANQGKGAYWAGIFIATGVGSALTLFFNFITSKGSVP